GARSKPGAARTSHNNPRCRSFPHRPRTLRDDEETDRGTGRKDQRKVRQDRLDAGHLPVPCPLVRTAGRDVRVERCRAGHALARRDESHRQGICRQPAGKDGRVNSQRNGGGAEGTRGSHNIHTHNTHTNPKNPEGIPAALMEALDMPLEEQVRRNQAMQDRLRRYDVVRWAEDFLDTLIAAKESNKNYLAKALGPGVSDQLFEDFHNSASRLLLFDYDGTLVGFVKQPHLAKPTEEVLKILE